jgi:hypothetical protein
MMQGSEERPCPEMVYRRSRRQPKQTTASKPGSSADYARPHDCDCTITGLRSADDAQGAAMQWVKGIENLNVSRFRT